MRKVVFSLLSSDAELQALVGDRIVERSALDDGGPAVKPFIVLGYAGTTRLGPGAEPKDLTLSVHDERGDYSRIGEVLSLCRTILESAIHVEVDGQHLSSAYWQGDSEDLYDDALRTNFRSAGYRLIGSAL